MNKNLPNVYAVPIEKKLHNNEDVYVGGTRKEEKTSISSQEIDKLFNSKNHVYKTRVKINTETETYEVDVVGRTNQALLTLDGQTIFIKDILEIKKV